MQLSSHFRTFGLTAFMFLLTTGIGAQFNVSTYAGTNAAGFVNGPVADARFNKPFGMCIGNDNALYIADQTNHCIRRVDISTGEVTTYAGIGLAGYLDGPDSVAVFNNPADVCMDDSGNVYVSDFNNQRIRKISPAGMVTTLAGSGIEGYIDGPGTTARFDYPRGVAVDDAGNIYVGDSWNHRIRKITPSGDVSTFAGGGSSSGVSSTGAYLDAPDTSARFWTPAGLSIDQSGNVYVADAYNHRIRKITPAGVVSTVAGSGASGPGAGGFADGPSASARLNTPTEVFFDAKNNRLLTGDTFGNRVRAISLSSDSVSTIAGTGASGYVNGAGTVAQFNYPRGVTTDTSGTFIFVLDFNNHCIRKIEASVPASLIAPESSAFFVTVYPNPSPGFFSFEFENGFSPDEIRIFDLSGKCVMQWLPESGQNVSLSLAALRDGFYTAEVVGHTTSRHGKSLRLYKTLLKQ